MAMLGFPNSLILGTMQVWWKWVVPLPPRKQQRQKLLQRRPAAVPCLQWGFIPKIRFQNSLSKFAPSGVPNPPAQSLGLLQRCDLENSSGETEDKKGKKGGKKEKKKRKVFNDDEVAPLAKGGKKDDEHDEGSSAGDDGSEEPKKKQKKQKAKSKTKAAGKKKKPAKEKKKKHERNQADVEPGSLEAAVAAMDAAETRAKEKTEISLLSDGEQDSADMFPWSNAFLDSTSFMQDPQVDSSTESSDSDSDVWFSVYPSRALLLAQRACCAQGLNSRQRETLAIVMEHEAEAGFEYEVTWLVKVFIWLCFQMFTAFFKKKM